MAGTYVNHDQGKLYHPLNKFKGNILQVIMASKMLIYIDIEYTDNIFYRISTH